MQVREPRKLGDRADDCLARRRGVCVATLFGALLIFAAGVDRLRAEDVPIPRPSPLGSSNAAPANDVAGSEASLLSETPGLSPGALLDPTNGSPRLNYGPDATAASPPGPTAGLGNRLPLGPEPPQTTSSLGSNPLLGVAPPTATQVRYHLEARLRTDGEPLPSGVTWRVFPGSPDPDDRLPLIGEAGGGAVDVRLPPGDYLVHAAYGRAGATKKITVGPKGGSDTIVINAGGLKLSALIGEDEPLGATDVSFDVYAPHEDGSDERVLLVSDAPPDKIIGLNAGVYHVICRYGEANAVVRADIRVEAGNLTEATVYQKAARLTLKLVSEHGGEALANTSWSVVTPEGDRVLESVGAFPSVVLAAGEYTAIASNQGQSYQRTFKVEAGLDRDVEVIAE